MHDLDRDGLINGTSQSVPNLQKPPLVFLPDFCLVAAVDFLSFNGNTSFVENEYAATFGADQGTILSSGKAQHLLIKGELESPTFQFQDNPIKII
jgi:hypothetical protein